ncbi:MAG: hypothetical protein ACJAW3_001490 [Lentimonas sp.]|jgi:hypothetical protein
MIKRYQINKIIFLITFLLSSQINAQNTGNNNAFGKAKEIVTGILQKNKNANIENQNSELQQKRLEDITNSKIPDLPSGQKDLETDPEKEKIKKPSLSEVFNSIIKDKKNEESIMYSDKEVQNIRSAYESFKNNTPIEEEIIEEEVEEVEVEENKKSHIYLGSILYRSNDSWLIWINDDKISNLTNKLENELYVKSIGKNKADIVWTMSISKWRILTDSDSEEIVPSNENNQVEINFTLSFNQTYVLNGNKVVEGRAGLSIIEKSKDEARSIINSTKDSVN